MATPSVIRRSEMRYKRVEGAGTLRHIGDMTETSTYPYTLEILSPRTEGATYQWAIRKGGKLVQRSDRSLTSEAKARENGLAQIEKLLSGFGER